MEKPHKPRMYKNRKSARPFSKNESLHIVLRSDIARNEKSMAQPAIRNWLKLYIPALAKRFQVKLYAISNNGSHLHLVLKADERTAISKFLRVLCGMIARRVLKAEKGIKSAIRFWTKRPYSRVITWGREFANVMRYVERNLLEAKGQLSYIARNQSESTVLKDYLDGRIYLNKRSRCKPTGS